MLFTLFIKVKEFKDVHPFFKMVITFISLYLLAKIVLAMWNMEVVHFWNFPTAYLFSTNFAV